jgi:hypothetical protein
VPECSVEFGAVLARPTRPWVELWVRVEFELAAFATAKPHRDNEELADVTGYDIEPRRRDRSADRELEEAEWIRTERCPDPGFYFSTDTTWLARSRHSWAARQRTNRSPQDAFHFLLDGRDGYLEILAAGFTWKAWEQGHPKLSDVTGTPILGATWGEPETTAELPSP